jgi:hypothetical protein
MIGNDTSETDYQWFTTRTIFVLLWERTLTRAGMSLLVVGTLVVATYAVEETGRLGAFIAAGVGVPLVYFTLLPLLLLTSTCGELLADLFNERVLKSRLSPRFLVHRVIYFLLSACGFILAAFVLGSGDADDLRYWRH